MSPALLIVIGYLLGSIPFGYLIVLLKQRTDVRRTGSGGTGATNVTRSAGRAAGLATLALDAAKGLAAVALARQFLETQNELAEWWTGAVALGALLGHIFPVWLKFRGGKGVATGLGAFVYLAPLAVMLSAALFLITVAATRYVSLGSIIAATTLPGWVWLLSDGTATPLIVTAASGGLLLVTMHRANIRRLLAGTENKLR